MKKLTHFFLHPWTSKAIYALALVSLLCLCDFGTQIKHALRAVNVVIELPRGLFPNTYGASTEMRCINGVNYPPALFSAEVQKDISAMNRGVGAKNGMIYYNRVRGALVGDGRTSACWSIEKKLLAVCRSDLSLVLFDTDKNTAAIVPNAVGPSEYRFAG